jgi:hypothetical protein
MEPCPIVLDLDGEVADLDLNAPAPSLNVATAMLIAVANAVAHCGKTELTMVHHDYSPLAGKRVSISMSEADGTITISISPNGGAH